MREQHPNVERSNGTTDALMARRADGESGAGGATRDAANVGYLTSR